MTTTAQIGEFLACKRIGFAGVSANPSDYSRTVFRAFVAAGRDLYPIHPTAQSIEARRAFSSILDAPQLDGVFIMTPPAETEGVVVDCHRAGVPRVWMHRRGRHMTVDLHAVQCAKAFGIDVVEGEDPLMFLPDPDRLHRAQAAVRRATGRYPQPVETPLLPRSAIHAIAFGAIAWTFATWAMLTLGGLFEWKTGLAARVVVLPLAFGILASLHVAPGRLAPLPAAAWFTAVGLVLDAAVLCGLVERNFALLRSVWLTWLPYALAFTAAVVVATHRIRPWTVNRLAFARG